MTTVKKSKKDIIIRIHSGYYFFVLWELQHALQHQDCVELNPFDVCFGIRGKERGLSNSERAN